MYCLRGVANGGGSLRRLTEELVHGLLLLVVLELPRRLQSLDCLALLLKVELRLHHLELQRILLQCHAAPHVDADTHSGHTQ